MGSKRTTWLVGVAAAAILLLLACDTLAAPPLRSRGPGRGFGPPAHAPAHGHRNKVVHGYTLIFDSACGLYLVVGLTDCYYHEGRFYRWRGGVWEISLRADKWEPAGHDKLPAAVRLKAKSLAQPNRPGNNDAKPNAGSNGKPENGGGRDAKPKPGSPGDPKPTASNDAKANPNGNSSAEPQAAGSEGQPATNAGGSTKPASPSDPKPNASPTGNSPTKPTAKSGAGSKKPTSSAKGRR